MNIFVKCWECWDVGDAENVGNGNIYLCFCFFFFFFLQWTWLAKNKFIFFGNYSSVTG